jgi:hypothetical protein
MNESNNNYETANGTKPVLGDGFGCHLFKFDNVAKLLSQIDERIYIMEKVSDDFKNIDGINLIELWRNLYNEIEAMWLQNMNTPIITLNKLQEIKLNVICDIVAQFFLYNGSEVDNDFLKNVGGLFNDVNQNYEIMSTEQRWELLKKAIA